MCRTTIIAVVSLCVVFAVGLIHAGDIQLNNGFYDDYNQKYNVGPVEIVKEGDKKIFKIGYGDSRRSLIYAVNNTKAWLPEPNVYIAGGYPNSEGTVQSISYAEITVESNNNDSVDADAFRMFYDKSINYRVYWRYYIKATGLTSLKYSVQVWA